MTDRPTQEEQLGAALMLLGSVMHALQQLDPDFKARTQKQFEESRRLMLAQGKEPQKTHVLRMVEVASRILNDLD